MEQKLGIFGLAILVVLTASARVGASPVWETKQDDSFPGLCSDCHGDSPKYPLLGATLEYNTSGHSANGNSHYANGDGCQQCHTHEGFLEYLEKGEVGDFVSVPSQPGCFTCHSPHTTGDFSLRTMTPVTLANGSKFDAGAGNLCANCHRARTDAQEEVKPVPANRVFSFWGAHHGPQADILAGTNAFEFSGKSYSSSGHRNTIKDGCAICHMAYPEGRYNLSPEVGGHSFSITGEVHEEGVLNTAACLKCHEGVKQVSGKEIFDIAAKEDFDLDGTVEPFQEEVVGILQLFSNDSGTGYLQRLDPPFFKADGSWNQVRTEGERSAREMAALYNYKLILEDRSKGVHNGVYSIQILYDSLKALDPTFDDSRRPE